MKKQTLLFSLLIIATQLFAQVPTNGLVAYYPFNSGSTADLSGNSNNGTNFGATLTTDHLGNPNSAYRFNGNGQYIEIPHSSTFNFSSNQMSISMWIKVEAFPGSFTSIAVSKQSGSGTTQSGFNVNQGSQTSFGLLLSSGGANFGGNTVPSNSTTLNTFRHVVFTYDGTTARAYLNGTISQTSSSQTATIGTNTVPLRLGKANWVNINAVDFTGVLDDIAIYNRVLTPQEVSSIYNSCSSTTATITPQSSTTFCQGSNVVLQASSGSSYSWSNGETTQSITVAQGNTYTVTVTDNNGCTASANQVVTVNPIPSINFSLPAFISNTVNNFSLNATPSGGTFSGTGVNGNIFDASQAGLGNKTISYSVTVNNCSNNATANTIVYDTTGAVCTITTFDTVTTTVFDTITTTINDTVTTSVSVTDTLLIDVTITGLTPPNNVNTVKVYPNPANNALFINNGNLASMAGYSIKITNSLGQIFFDEPVNQQQFFIDISTWATGTYLLYVINPQQAVVETKQVVLQ
jgi:hypothetical protein